MAHIGSAAVEDGNCEGRSPRIGAQSRDLQMAIPTYIHNGHRPALLSNAKVNITRDFSVITTATPVQHIIILEINIVLREGQPQAKLALHRRQPIFTVSQEGGNQRSIKCGIVPFRACVIPERNLPVVVGCRNVTKQHPEIGVAGVGLAVVVQASF